jgi:hypothetical protein
MREWVVASGSPSSSLLGPSYSSPPSSSATEARTKIYNFDGPRTLVGHLTAEVVACLEMADDLEFSGSHRSF